MPHPNAELITRAYDAFGRGDIVSVLGILSDDIRWRVPGQSPLSGDYNGHGEVLNFFTKSAGLSGGTLRIDVHDILADDSKVFVLCTVSATRAGKSVGFLEVHVWMMANGRAVEFREFQGDALAEDKFWAGTEA
jgi:uncharacterized protein